MDSDDLHELLKHLTAKLEYEIKDSKQLIDSLRNLPIETTRTFPHAISLDVATMYPSLPRKDVIGLVSDKLKNERFYYHGLDWEDIRDLLRTVLGSTVFTFNGKWYRQKSGLPIGSRISGLLATMFMNEIERRLVPELPLALYTRYVDDTFILTRNGDDARTILQSFNSSHPQLTFTMEEAVNKRLNLLDFSIETTENGLKIGFYRKEARSDIFINSKTALPTSMKEQIVKNERQRIADRCDSNTEKKRELAKFQQRLERNGFSEIQRTRNKRDGRGKSYSCFNDTPLFFSVPFVSDALNGRLRRMFLKAGVKVVIAHKGRSLRNILQKTIPQRKCSIPNCTTPKHLCHRSNVVYQLTCRGCNAKYIGMTRRHLHTKIREHLTIRTSPIYNHRDKCQPQRDICVLSTARDVVDLQLKEAMLIQSQQPTLNNRDEIAHFRLL